MIIISKLNKSQIFNFNTEKPESFNLNDDNILNISKGSSEFKPRGCLIIVPTPIGNLRDMSSRHFMLQIISTITL